MNLPVVTKIKTLIYKWISKRYMAGCSNYNSLQVRRNSRSKEQARAMFAKHQVPHAQGQIFINPFTAARFAKQHGYPLVIKPNVSGFSRGSHFPIKNSKELWKAALMVKVWWPSSVIEQYLEGANYRVLATQDQIVSIIRRYPPFIDGNGNDSIGNLIDAENVTRKAMNLHPTIYPIKKSPGVRSYLAKQKLSFDSVPENGERVYLFNRVALAPGGIVETIDQSTVPDINKALFCDVVKQFDASLFGIDVILEHGIEQDYTTQKCIFLEVNSRPYTRMHEKPRYGEVDDLQPFYAHMDSLIVSDTNTF